MKNSEILSRYESYLKEEKQASENTRSSYLRDLRQLDTYLSSKGLVFYNTDEQELLAFLDKLQTDGKSEASCARHRSTLRSFYRWMAENGMTEKALSLDCCAYGKREKKLPEILNSGEVTLLLRQPDRADAKGLRDAAMLELMVATGIRVSELLDLQVSDVDFVAGILCCSGRNRERKIPIYPYALRTLQNYIRSARPLMIGRGETGSLFLNLNGERMSRQGFWKLVKLYQQKAGIDKEITPQMLRHSFAAHLLETGTDMASIQRMMGHADISSTRMYSQVIRKRAENACGLRA